LAEQVGEPKFADTDDPWLIAGRYKQAFLEANARLYDTRGCQQVVRGAFAGTSFSGVTFAAPASQPAAKPKRSWLGRKIDKLKQKN